MHFAPGKTEKTVAVPVPNDAHDEGSETLALSRPFGAQPADGTTTEIVVNTAPLPRALVVRFGRTVRNPG